jgi:hypothetical protein
MTPSYAFVAQPETNGVIERLFRTFKEQVVYGRIFQTIEEVPDAVRAFVARYKHRVAGREERPRQPHGRERAVDGNRPQGGRVVQTMVQETGCKC